MKTLFLYRYFEALAEREVSMSRKIISFLGTSKYLECMYKLNGKVAAPQVYIQAALIELLA